MGLRSAESCVHRVSVNVDRRGRIPAARLQVPAIMASRPGSVARLAIATRGTAD